MSVSTVRASLVAKLPRQSDPPAREPLRLKILEWLVFVLVTGLVITRVATGQPLEAKDLQDLAAWFVLVVATDLFPVPLWGSLTLALSLPILLAAGMVYQPHVVGLLALLGSTDLREISRDISLPRGLFNRSQIALSAMAASWVFHRAHGDLHSWPAVLAVALLSVAADFAVNLSMIEIATRILGPARKQDVLSYVHGGQPLPFLSSYVGFGLVAVLLGVAYEVSGNWGLVAFVIPVLLARRVFVQSRRLRDMADTVSEKTRMLLAVSERIAEERRDERLAAAAGLHDEVLPPLYQVHLMGQVIRQDLATGQLLALEDDVPDLLRATENASDAIRILIRDLRHSALGPGGLADTLRLLVRHFEAESNARIHLDVEEVGGSPVVQLLAFQIAREALRNAVNHSHATNIWLRVVRDGGDMRLIVEDDGSGFEQSSVDSENHFGLQLMRERVELAGGLFQLESHAGSGTHVIARLPAETTDEGN